VILVDTSVWIDHLRSGNPALARLLDNNAVMAHRWVTGELALGNLHNRTEIIGLLGDLPQAIIADDDEVMRLIDLEPLHGSGIGYVEAQVLASAKLTPETRIWTSDKHLKQVTSRVGLDFEPTSIP
jgi:predicted nucleic acid-binding protein